MNPRHLIIGSVSAFLILMGALLLTNTADVRGGAVDDGAVAAAPEPAPEQPPAAGDTMATDSGPEARGDADSDAAARSGAGGDSQEAASTDARSGASPDRASADGASAGPAPGGTTGERSHPESVRPPDSADEESEADEAAEAAEAGARSPEAILRATARAYEGLRSFRADFEQVLRNTLLGRTTRSTGTLYQRQPDRFLMDYSDPEGDLIVSDGEYFWMYFPSADPDQVLRTPRGVQGLDLHAQFIGDPVRRFEFTSHGTETVRGRTAHVMTLVPREPLGYRRLKAWIDDADHLVRRFELTEGNGNVRRFELTDLSVNPSLPDDLFEFTPPAGARVVTR